MSEYAEWAARHKVRREEFFEIENRKAAHPHGSHGRNNDQLVLFRRDSSF